MILSERGASGASALWSVRGDRSRAVRDDRDGIRPLQRTQSDGWGSLSVSRVEPWSVFCASPLNHQG